MRRRSSARGSRRTAPRSSSSDPRRTSAGASPRRSPRRAVSPSSRPTTTRGSSPARARWASRSRRTCPMSRLSSCPSVAAAWPRRRGGDQALAPGARVIGVEPELAADARDSLAQDRIVAWPADLVGRTIADGTRTQSIGRLNFAHLRVQLDAVDHRHGDRDRRGRPARGRGGAPRRRAVGRTRDRGDAVPRGGGGADRPRRTRRRRRERRQRRPRAVSRATCRPRSHPRRSGAVVGREPDQPDADAVVACNYANRSMDDRLQPFGRQPLRGIAQFAPSRRWWALDGVIRSILRNRLAPLRGGGRSDGVIRSILRNGWRAARWRASDGVIRSILRNRLAPLRGGGRRMA